jgi:hypothetical protein
LRETTAASTTGPDTWLATRKTSTSPAQLAAAGAELAHVQLMAIRAEPTHAHIAPTYAICRGRSGTRPRAAHEGQDRTPHADEEPFS